MHHRPHQPHWRVRSFTMKFAFCSRSALNKQACQYRNWWKSVAIVAPCRRGTDRVVQSRTRLVTWPIIWQQFTSSPFRSVLPQAVWHLCAIRVSAGLLPSWFVSKTVTCRRVCQADLASLAQRLVFSSVCLPGCFFCQSFLVLRCSL